MRGSSAALRAAAVYGLLAASSTAAVSPHATRLHHRAPEVSPTTTSTPTTGAASSVTAVSECHLHDTTLWVCPALIAPTSADGYQDSAWLPQPSTWFTLA